MPAGLAGFVAPPPGVPVRTFSGMRALRLAAGLLRALRPAAKVYLPSEAGEGQRQLLASAGFRLDASPYLPGGAPRKFFPALLSALCRLPEHSVVVMRVAGGQGPQAMTRQQWAALADACKSMHHIPILEIASRDLGRAGRESEAVRGMADSGVPFLLMHLGAGRIAISLRDDALAA